MTKQTLVFKYHKKFLSVLILCLGLTFLSCEKEDEHITENSDDLEISPITYDRNAELKRDFAHALGKALKESVPLREFLKNEALKMFNGDYDVLYHKVKNQSLSDGTSFRNLLLKHYPSEARLKAIEIEIPLLTIFIPKLPNDTYSAETWDTANVIPEIALKMNTTNHVPVINTNGEEYVLPDYAIPAFPVLVIKENERVVTRSNGQELKKGETEIARQEDLVFTFLDEVFNGTKINALKSKRENTNFDPKVIKAYNIYNTADGWQRDYIYYDLTHANTKNQFNYDFQEHITTFSMNGDAEAAFTKIGDQTGDPTLNLANQFSIGRPKIPTAWTGGYFEFEVKTLINATNGVGSEISTFFSAKPEDLFIAEYTERKTGSIIRLFFYEIKSLKTKTMDINLPIFNWDLNEYASSIKIEIEEVDLTEKKVITDERSVKFATNFSIDGGFLKKIGLKFGASREITQKQTIQKSFTQGNDQLGSVIINFADDIIIRENSGTYITREYSTGLFKIGVEPIRVQGN